jgi:hypothetical protein
MDKLTLRRGGKMSANMAETFADKLDFNGRFS